MTPYEKLREECNRRLPDRLELKFGCEVRHTPLRELGIDYRGTYLHPARGKGMHLLYSAGERTGSQQPYSTTISEKYFTPIGTPLTIADVLRVLNQKDVQYKKERHSRFNGRNTPFWVINSYGLVLQVQDPETLAESIAPTGIKFNLAAPLSDPSNAAACEAVLSIITKK